jgi:hypothetical protein
MARQIIKQPNGKYAEYSTIVNAFIMHDATADQIIQNARQEAADEAERRCKDALENADTGKIHGFGLTWEEALKNHNQHCPPDDRIESSHLPCPPGH